MSNSAETELDLYLMKGYHLNEIENMKIHGGYEEEIAYHRECVENIIQELEERYGTHE